MLLLIAIGSGGWYYYNTHVLNEFQNSKARRHIQAALRARLQEIRGHSAAQDHRRRHHRRHLPRAPLLLRHRPLTSCRTKPPRPSRRYTSLDTRAVRHERSLRSPVPHSLVEPASTCTPSMRSISRSRPAKRCNMNFNVGLHAARLHGRQRAPRARLQRHILRRRLLSLSSATTATSSSTTRAAAARNTLARSRELPHRGDPGRQPYQSLHPRLGLDLPIHTVVSTSDDQIALAPGYLQKDWHQNGRHYYEYNMGDVKIARLLLLRLRPLRREARDYHGVAGNINIEVYSRAGAPLRCRRHDRRPPKPASAITRRTTAHTNSASSASSNSPATASSRSPSPTPSLTPKYWLYRPRAQSPDDIDFTYFVTAHELAHQWWGHQLIGGRVEGSNMMSESAGRILRAARHAEEIRRRPDAQVPQA